MTDAEITLATVDRGDIYRDFGSKTKWQPRVGPELPFERVNIKWLHNIVGHLRNRRRLLEREADAAAGYSGQGEMASYYADQAMREAMDRADELGGVIVWLEGYLEWREVHECVTAIQSIGDET